MQEPYCYWSSSNEFHDQKQKNYKKCVKQQISMFQNASNNFHEVHTAQKIRP